MELTLDVLCVEVEVTYACHRGTLSLENEAVWVLL